MGLPSPHKPSRFISPLRARQLHRALKNLKLTLICGLLTVLVLRGALGAGKFGTPATDYEEIKYQFERVHNLHIARKHASRVLTEVVEERHRPIEAIEAQAHSTSYVLSVDAKVQSNGRLQGKHALKESNLDVQVTIDPVKPFGLSPKISDSAVLPLQTNPNPVGSKPKVMLVTGYHPSACENPKGNHYLLKFVKNKVDYCKVHGIEILYNSDLLDAELSGPSAKFRMLSRLMRAHPQVEWFWWMASDALFTDMAFELPMENFINYNVVLLGWGNMPKTGVPLTSGSFLIRNCDWSLNMLDTWALMDSKGQVAVEAGAKSLPGQPNLNNQPMSTHMLINEKRKWGEEVPLEKSTFLHGYWEVPVKQSEEEMKKNQESDGSESRPFVTRFTGYKLCKKGADDSDTTAALYVRYIEGALDSADSQVLQLNSFQPKSSSLSALRRLRGGHNGISVSTLDVLPSISDQFKHKSHSLS